jgi:hypothetical protein
LQQSESLSDKEACDTLLLESEMTHWHSSQFDNLSPFPTNHVPERSGDDVEIYSLMAVWNVTRAEREGRVSLRTTELTEMVG